jgi:ribonuclease J
VRLRIHHAASEVGGNCLELEQGGERLLLDIGMPLESEARLPALSGLTEPDPSLLGVVLSHPHLDHYGLLPACRPDLPVWLGASAKKLLEAASPFTAGSVVPQTISTYLDRTPFEIGPFRLTPFLMDHSAFDAYGLLVEAGGRRLYYSGDFRGHGRKAAVFDRFLTSPPANIDLLLMEGTSIGRSEAPLSEADVEAQAAEVMRGSSGLTLLCFSGQNIDRVVSFLRASMKAGRQFVIDAYTAALLDAVALKGLPRAVDHPGLRIYLPKAQKRMIVRDSRFDLIEPYRSRRIFADELLGQPERFSLVFRASVAGDLAGANLAGGALIYSLWPGYLDRDKTDLRAWASDRGLAFHQIHSSGHAYEADLRRMAEAINPARLTPIHTADPHAFKAIFPRVVVTKNGAWMAV